MSKLLQQGYVQNTEGWRTNIKLEDIEEDGSASMEFPICIMKELLVLVP